MSFHYLAVPMKELKLEASRDKYGAGGISAVNAPCTVVMTFVKETGKYFVGLTADGKTKWLAKGTALLVHPEGDLLLAIGPASVLKKCGLLTIE